MTGWTLRSPDTGGTARMQSRKPRTMTPTPRRRRMLRTVRSRDSSVSSSCRLALLVVVVVVVALCLMGTSLAHTSSVPLLSLGPYGSKGRRKQHSRILQDSTTSYQSQTLEYEYELYASDDLVNASVGAIERQVAKSLRAIAAYSNGEYNTTWIQVANRDVDSVVEPCYNDPDEEGEITPSDCHHVVTTIAAKVDARMDTFVVEQVALGNIRSFLSTYNSQQADVFVEYLSPMLVTAVVRLTAVGLTTAMNGNRQELFLAVFDQGFGTLMSSSNTDPPLTLRESRILYQVTPRISNQGQQRRRTLRRQLDGTATAGGTQQDADTSLQLSMMVRATCGTVACTSQYLRDFIMSKGDQYGSAWVEGIHYRATNLHTNNDAISTYFAPLTQILFDDTVMDSDYPAIGSIYYPAAADTMMPSWLWIALGVDGLIWLLALVWVLVQVRRRRNRRAVEGEENLGQSRIGKERQRRSNSPRKEAWKDEPSESRNESERIYDDGIRVRTETENNSQYDGDDDFTDSPEMDSFSLSSSGHNGSAVETPPSSGAANDITKGEPPESSGYDDGVRISTDPAGQTSRIHDAGIRVSNSIEDID